MNLVPDKKKAFAETLRILKPGGHFSISDIVLEGELPEGLRKEATLYAGCVSGAEQKERYLSIIKEAGFKNIVVQKERQIDLPNEILVRYLTTGQLAEFKNNHVGIFSISVYAEKPEISARRILILCTGNSCRSQMAEGFLKSFDPSLEVFSAGTKAASSVHPKAISVMKECGIDISKNYPKTVDQFLAESFDYVITVCGNAKERCPVFTGSVKNRIHIGFDDPAEAKGTEEEVLTVFRKVRDEIKRDLYDFYLEKNL
jgi:arsenate reductase